MVNRQYRWFSSALVYLSAPLGAGICAGASNEVDEIGNRCRRSMSSCTALLALLIGAGISPSAAVEAGRENARAAAPAARLEVSQAAGNQAKSQESGVPLGMDAPLLKVDRFSDSAATLLRRSRVPGLPGPGQPIHLDESPFLVPLTAKGWGAASCYNLDVRPAEPARFYVFYDTAGNYVLTQFPVVDIAPGDPGYTDLWDIWKVTVPAGFPLDNSIRDRETVERLLKDAHSGYTAERTGALLNGPIVPEGSTARHKAEGREGPATLRYAWCRGKRAPYLYFEQKLRIQGERAPVGEMILEARDGSQPLPPALSVLTAGKPEALTLATLPGDPGYSPLRRLLGPDGKSVLEGIINCPVVGP
jgi:hypothetical protein